RGRIRAGGVDGDPPAAVVVELPDGYVLGDHPAPARDAHGDGAKYVAEAVAADHVIHADGPHRTRGPGARDGVLPEHLDGRAAPDQVAALGEQPGVGRVARGHPARVAVIEQRLEVPGELLKRLLVQ